MGADLERRRAAFGKAAIVVERGLHYLAERAERGARRYRIGAIRRDQHRRLVAAAHRTLEIRGNFHREQHLSRDQQLVEFGFAVRQFGDLEIFGIFQRRQNRTAEIALLLQQYGGRQIPRVGVDGVAEQNELHEWNQ